MRDLLFGSAQGSGNIGQNLKNGKCSEVLGLDSPVGSALIADLCTLVGQRWVRSTLTYKHHEPPGFVVGGCRV